MSAPSRTSSSLAALAVLILIAQDARAQIFNYTTALSGWNGNSGTRASAQTNSSTPVVRQSMDVPAKLGAIFYKSIAQNQSFAVAEAMRWMLQPSAELPVPTPNDRISRNLGAAVAYAMQYAHQSTTNYTVSIGAPQANATVLRSGVYPLVSVTPNATDVFYVAASALMAVVTHGCDIAWRCHGFDCLTPEDVVRKRMGACCTSVSPMLVAISRQLHLFGYDNLIDDAMPSYIQAQNPTVLEFLSRCNKVDFGNTSVTEMSACNTNASSNYMGNTVLLDVNSNTPGAPPVASALDCCLACMGNAQCNVWVYCGGEHGCSGCNSQALNYRAAAGSDGQTFGPYGRGCNSTTFPIGTCTLKSAAFKTRPQADSSSSTSSSFTSGFLAPHSAAQGS